MKLALCGASGAGKSTIAELLASSHGFTVASTGTICRRLAMRLFGSEERRLLNLISESIRSERVTFFLEAALGHIQSDNIVFDSARYIEDVQFLKSLGFFMIRVVARSEETLQRLSKRHQDYSATDLHHASETDLATIPVDFEIDTSEGNITDVRSQLTELLAIKQS